jgi:hypothetical protein
LERLVVRLAPLHLALVALVSLVYWEEVEVEEAAVDKQPRVERDQQAHLLVVDLVVEEVGHLQEQMALHLVVKVVQRLVAAAPDQAIQVE